MLKRITVKNFKCFKNETIFDFKKTNYKLLEQNTCGKILKGALFVGDNASGKTTAIQPIKLLLDLLCKDKDVFLFLYQCFFSQEDVTSLKFEFDMPDCEIVYAFSFTKESIVEEKLEVDRQCVIERIGNNAKLFMEDVSSFHDVDGSLLFLRRVYFNTKFEGHTKVKNWFQYLKNTIYIDSYKREITQYGGESLALLKYVEAHSTDELNNFFQKNNFQYTIQYTKLIEKEGISFEMDEKEGKMIFLEREGMTIPIPLFMESAGTQTLLCILPAILNAIELGGMLIIDEFSSGLHNKLEELLVSYIMKNSSTTQLFFVSHSTNLLTNSLLRPDQIYTVELEGNEGSKLYRFSDEQPRIAQNLEKMYLSGVFGGVPEYGTE